MDLTVADFDFELPDERIALRPARPRDSARLLLVPPDTGAFGDHVVRDLPGLLRPGDLMVFNDTRTIPAALKAWRPARPGGGGAGVPVEADINLHQRTGPDRWKAFARPAKRLAAGEVISFAGGLTATIAARGDGGEVELVFDRAGPALDVAVAQAGVMPLPPYIARKRAVDAADSADYQTVYARADGSVATPTAGLHFTPELLAALEARGVERTWVTLHVGAGTFLPVKAEKLADHVMHAETFEVSEAAASAINRARAEGRRILAVGTTSLRTLESIADSEGRARALAGDTAIFITPGHRFRLVDGLMTNFHLPRSTLMMLVSALAGHRRVMDAYAHAIARGYRFYSYGDASLFWRAGAAP
jgi:S-adenosylmethionine:tRNA ribosyltransferase-isomerase